MTTNQPQNEPSMEEILASIRRIISDEPQEGSAQAEEAASVADDVFELTPAMRAQAPVGSGDQSNAGQTEEDQSVDFESNFDSPAEPEPDPFAEKPVKYVHQTSSETPDDVFDSASAAGRTFEEAPAVSSVEDFVSRTEEGDEQADDRIVSPHTERAAAHALAGLSALSNRTAFEGHTVEALVRELLRPMLRQWMDQNLPSLVERLVEAEIERLSRRGR